MYLLTGKGGTQHVDETFIDPNFIRYIVAKCMNYKYVTILVLSFILLLTVSFSYFKSHEGDKMDSSLLRAIPAASPLILSMQDVTSVHDLLEGIEKNEFVQNSMLGQKLLDQFNTLQSILMIGKENQGSELLIILQSTGAKDYDFLYITKFPRLDIYSESAIQYFEENGFSSETRTFRNEQILSLTSGSSTISMFQDRDILVLSFSTVPVDESIIAYKDNKYSITGSILAEKLGEPERGDITLFVSYAKLNTLSGFMISDEFSFINQAIGKNGEVAVLDLDLSESEIILNGDIFFENKETSGIREERKITNFTKIVPANVSLLQASTINQEIRVEEYGFFRNWISGGFAHFALECYADDLNQVGLLAIEIEDGSIAREDLGELNSILEAGPVSEYRGYNIRQVDYSSFINELFPNSFIKIGNSEMTFIDDMMILANNKRSLEKLIDLYNNNQVLYYSPEYNDFSRFIGQYASSYFYFNPDKAVTFAKNMFRNNPPGKIGIQYAALGNDVYTNLLLKTSSLQQFSIDEMMWRFPLEGSKPQNIHLVKNHYSGENEVLLQDTENKIYLIDNTGEVLWERQLNSSIVGEVNQIDFFNNGKLQMAFVTKGQILVIDRNGKDLAPYPIKLSSPPASGLAIFNYDQRDGHRLFIAGENGNVYGYYKDGKPLPGWNPLLNNSRLMYPLRHVIAGGKDMIIGSNSAGEIVCYNRKGEVRFKPVKTECDFKSPLFFTADMQEMQISALCEKGLLTSTLKGEFRINESALYKDSVPMVLHQINAGIVLLKAESNALRIYGPDGAILADYPTPFTTSSDLRLFKINGFTFAGIRSKPEGELLFMDMDGGIVEDFPMKAMAPYTVNTIESSGESVLIASFENGLFAYRLRLNNPL